MRFSSLLRVPSLCAAVLGSREMIPDDIHFFSKGRKDVTGLAMPSSDSSFRFIFSLRILLLWCFPLKRVSSPPPTPFENNYEALLE